MKLSVTLLSEVFLEKSASSSAPTHILETCKMKKRKNCFFKTMPFSRQTSSMRSPLTSQWACGAVKKMPQGVWQLSETMFGLVSQHITKLPRQISVEFMSAMVLRTSTSASRCDSNCQFYKQKSKNLSFSFKYKIHTIAQTHL